MEQQPHAEIWARDVGNWLNCGLRESKRTRRARANPDAGAVHVAEVVKQACYMGVTGEAMGDVPKRVRYDKDTSDAQSMLRDMMYMPPKFADWLRDEFGAFGVKSSGEQLKADYVLGDNFRVRFRAEIEALAFGSEYDDEYALLELSCAERPPTQALAKLAMTAWLWNIHTAERPPSDGADYPDVTNVALVWLPRDRTKEVHNWVLGYRQAAELGLYIARMAATHARDQMPTPGHFCQYCPVRECVLRAVEE